ncbi:AEC family transporter [Mycoplasmopsis opalescens]|uniref:hypothetical protein n=1 Tax=Mycoplasmopsis opalescens TaxID=114886 RepID=UPI0004A71A7D|nr:hypothetical protein [Mycoplasmopsis opalescens]
MNNFSTIFLSVTKQQALWGGILATFLFIAMGFIVTRKGIFDKEINKKLSAFNLKYALPFICLTAFMISANTSQIKIWAAIFILSILFYTFAILVGKLLINYYPHLVSKRITAKAEALWRKKSANENGVDLEKYKEEALADYKAKYMAFQWMNIFGSLQFFAYPLIIALNGSGIFNSFSLVLAQTWCVPYMVSVFIILPLEYSGLKFSKKNIKPIMQQVFSPMMCCLYLSLVLWLLQFIPGIYEARFGEPNDFPYDNLLKDGPAGSDAAKDYAKAPQFWGAFKTNMTFLMSGMTMATGLVSPLAWLVIGGSLAASNLKEVIKDKGVWTATVVKNFIYPLVTFGIMFLFVLPIWGKLNYGEVQLTGELKGNAGLLDPASATLIVLMMATPPAAVNVIFASANKHRSLDYIAKVSSLSTAVCVISMPLFIILSSIAYQSVVAIPA